MEEKIYTLPGGWVDAGGAVHREVILVPLSGREEALLAESSRQGSASLVTRLLSRCVQRIGEISPVSEAFARGLIVADRLYLLLKLREVTFGPRVQATIACPWPDCGKKVDIDFSIHDIPVTPSEDKGPFYQMHLSSEAAPNIDGEKQAEVVFRLPTGEDQEVIGPLLVRNEAQALNLLLARCIQSIGGLNVDNPELIDGLSPLARMQIEKQMLAAAPQVDLEMGAVCPECGREFSVPFDLQDFFFGEMRTSRDLLYREVHYLAYHYHWSEKEIMEMPKQRRRTYIEILADEIERLNSAV